MVSLFQYLCEPAGKELGLRVSETAIKLSIRTGYRSVNTPFYTGTVSTYPVPFLDFYFTEIEPEIKVEQESKPTPKFKIGDKAFKPKGYKFPCTIVSVFKSSKGIRVVGEMDEYGLLHIFNEDQLEHYSYEPVTI